jgi:hypothetical protein
MTTICHRSCIVALPAEVTVGVERISGIAALKSSGATSWWSSCTASRSAILSLA